MGYKQFFVYMMTKTVLEQRVDACEEKRFGWGLLRIDHGILRRPAPLRGSGDSG